MGYCSQLVLDSFEMNRRFFLLAAPAIVAVPLSPPPTPIALNADSPLMGGVTAGGVPWVEARVATPAQWNALLADISESMSTCFLRDGSQTVTALPA